MSGTTDTSESVPVDICRAKHPDAWELIARFRAVQRATLDARPRGVVVTGDVHTALAPLVFAELAPVGELTFEESASLRWLCGWEPETIARVVGLVRHAHRVGFEAGREAVSS